MSLDILYILVQPKDAPTPIVIPTSRQSELIAALAGYGVYPNSDLPRYLPP